MARKNIFELLDAKWDIKGEISRLVRLFETENVIKYYTSSFTLKSFVDQYCFDDWKNRGRYIDVKDYLKELQFIHLYMRADKDIECFLTTIEIIYNFYYIAYAQVQKNKLVRCERSFTTLHENLDMCLDHYNHAAFWFKDKEQVIVAEKDSVITAVAEISDSETAFQIIRYNHHSLKGDITTKKRILLHFASELEPKRSALNSMNKALSDDIFTLLNNMNLRHNNCDPQSKEYKKYIADMSVKTLEFWYDKLYQMILLAKLELDHIERKGKITELKTHF